MISELRVLLVIVLILFFVPLKAQYNRCGFMDPSEFQACIKSDVDTLRKYQIKQIIYYQSKKKLKSYNLADSYHIQYFDSCYRYTAFELYLKQKLYSTGHLEYDSTNNLISHTYYHYDTTKTAKDTTRFEYIYEDELLIEKKKFEDKVLKERYLYKYTTNRELSEIYQFYNGEKVLTKKYFYTNGLLDSLETYALIGNNHAVARYEYDSLQNEIYFSEHYNDNRPSWYITHEYQYDKSNRISHLKISNSQYPNVLQQTSVVFSSKGRKEYHIELLDGIIEHKKISVYNKRNNLISFKSIEGFQKGEYMRIKYDKDTGLILFKEYSLHDLNEYWIYN